MIRESNFLNKYLYEYTSTDDMLFKNNTKLPQSESKNLTAQVVQRRERTTEITMFFGGTSGHYLRTDMEDRPVIEFCSGSTYLGDWNQFGMCGQGHFTLPNGIRYQGMLREGHFHGRGKLVYPNGITIHGIWCKGKLKRPVLLFHDGLKFKKHNWKYCEYPDRRYQTCIENGIPAIGKSYIAPTKPARYIPQGCYDTIDGIFNPKLKIVYNPDTRRIIRIPTKKECDWIIENCRRGTFKEIPEHRKPVRNESNYQFGETMLKSLSNCDPSQSDTSNKW